MPKEKKYIPFACLVAISIVWGGLALALGTVDSGEIDTDQKTVELTLKQSETTTATVDVPASILTATLEWTGGENTPSSIDVNGVAIAGQRSETMGGNVTWRAAIGPEADGVSRLLVRPGDTKLTFTGSAAPLSAQVKLTYRTLVDGGVVQGAALDDSSEQLDAPVEVATQQDEPEVIYVGYEPESVVDAISPTYSAPVSPATLDQSADEIALEVIENEAAPAVVEEMTIAQVDVTNRDVTKAPRSRALALSKTKNRDSSDSIVTKGVPGSPDPVLPLSIFGCVDSVVEGVGLHGDGAGSITINVPGPVLYAVIEWVGGEDDTPTGAGTSTLQINGADVEGILTGQETVWATWYAWHADIGPNAPVDQRLITGTGSHTLNISGWDATKYENGATVTVIYDTGTCTDPKELTFFTGVDVYYHGSSGNEFSDLLVYPVIPSTTNRTATMIMSHAGTDANQTSCRGGAIWMLAGSGPQPIPGAFDIAWRYSDSDANAKKGYGINGGVEIVNDPFTSPSLPCTPTVNPVPDAPYEAGHPYPGGAPAAPYFLVSMTPNTGGDVSAEWGVLELEVMVPAGSEWIAFQMESERDQGGESGSWAGGGAFTLDNAIELVDVEVTTVASPAIADLGDTVVLTVSAVNAGIVDFTAVQIEDLIPASLTLVNTTSSAGSYNSTNGIWDVGALPVGAVEELALTVTVANDCAGITDCAQIISTTPADIVADNDTDCATIIPGFLTFGNRVTDGMIAYYPMTDGVGSSVITDQSGFASPLDLNIQSGNTTFLAGRNGIDVNSSSVIKTPGAATKIYNEATGSQEITVELWCKPDNISQSGPARMVSLSQNASYRNFTLGQEGDDLDLRIRRTDSTLNGTASVSSGNIMDTLERHYVATFNSAGQGKLYQDGVLMTTSSYGPISGWDPTHPFMLANEATGDRAWLGEIYMVAVYNRSLTDAEVLQNFGEGSDLSAFSAGANIEVSSPANLCIDEVGAFAVTNPDINPGAQYQWSFGAGASPATAAGVGPHNVSWSSLGTRTVNVTLTGGACGDGQAFFPMDVNCQADLAVTKTSSVATFSLGDQIVYTVSVENTGSQDFSDVTIVDVLPDSVNLIGSPAASSGVYSPFASSWTLSNLAVGDIETLTLTTETLSDCGDIVNCAELGSSTPPDVNPDNDQECVIATPQLQVSGERVTDSLIAYYPLTQDSGTRLIDQIDFDVDADLDIQSGNVTFLAARNGISVNSASVIISPGRVQQIEDAIEDDSGAFTVEMWCKPANLSQSGPARMFSYSLDAHNRNFTLGQQGDDLRLRVRRNGSDNNGTPEMNAANVMTTDEAHYVGVFEADGSSRLYKDGVEVSSASWNPINFTWNSSYYLSLANEYTGGRAWLGEIYLVALYNKALSQTEIDLNFALGSNPDDWEPVATVEIVGPGHICAQDDATYSLLNTEAGAAYSWDFGPNSTPSTAVGTNVTVSWSSQGLRTIILSVAGGTCGDSSASYQVDVNCPPPGLCEGVCGIPPALDGQTLWGIESDEAFLWSMSDYNDPFGTFVKYGDFVWDDAGVIRLVHQHVEALDIGPDGTIYLVYNHDLGIHQEPVLLTYNVSDAVPGQNANMTVVGQIAIPFDHAGDNVVGVSFNPDTGLLYALLKDDDSTVTDRLYVIDPTDGSLVQDVGLVKGTVDGSVYKAVRSEEMEFIAGGRLLVSDNFDDVLYEVDPNTAAIIGVYDNDEFGGTGHSSGKYEGMAYDFINDVLLGTDDFNDILVRFSEGNGNNTTIDSIGPTPLFLTDVEGIDFLPIFTIAVCEPAIVWPSDIVVECPYAGTIDSGEPVITGECCTLSVTNIDNVIMDACAETIERTWIVTDECGRTQSSLQIITVVDTTGPTLSGVPSDETVECDTVPSPPTVTANDVCEGPAVVTFDETMAAGSCTDNVILTRTWSAADSCGNLVTETQTVTVVDTTDPVLAGVPADETVECDAIPDPPVVTATDNCDTSMTVDLNETTTAGACSSSFILTRTWSATDDCGNVGSQSQTITVEDTTAPVLAGVPVDETVECDSVPGPPGVTATDNCDPSVVVDFNETRTDGSCTDTYTLTRTWSATDECGNVGSQSQTILVQDTIAPTLSGVPEGITVECDAIPSPAAVTGSDNCDGDVTVDVSDSQTPGACEGTFVLTRTWTATDNCDNSASESQTITVVDTTAPVITCPGLRHMDVVDPLATLTPTIDDCDPNVIVMQSPLAGSTNLPLGTNMVTLTATDDCGNQSMCDAMVVVTSINATVDGVVWFDGVDLSNDGLQGPLDEEFRMVGITVQIFDTSDNLIDTEVTDDEGVYFFDNVPTGMYIVEITPPGPANPPNPSCFVPTLKDAPEGANTMDEIDNDFNPDYRTDPFQATGGESIQDLDAGLINECSG